MSDFRNLKNCPVCSKSNNRCRINSQDYILCRSSTDKEINGYRNTGATSCGTWNGYILIDSQVSRVFKTSKTVKEYKLTHHMYSPLEFDREFFKLRSICGLKAEDYEALFRHRNVGSYGQFNRKSFISVRAGVKLGVDLSSLPGFNETGWAGKDGVLIPTFWNNLNTGYQFQPLHAEKGGKYKWASSYKDGKQVLSSHVKTGSTYELPLTLFKHKTSKTVVLTEGVAKPLYAYGRLQKEAEISVLGSAGAQWSGSPTQLKSMLQGFTTVLFAPDAGSRSNFQIWNKIKKTVELISSWKREDLTLKILDWGQLDSKEDGMDIDEISVDTFKQAIPLSWQAVSQVPTTNTEEVGSAFTSFADMLKSVVIDSGVAKRGSSQLKGYSRVKTEQNAVKQVSLNLFVYKKGCQQDAIQKAKSLGYKYVLERSQTGSGKSHGVGNFDLSYTDSDIMRIRYITNSVHNLPTKNLINNFSTLMPRHNGMYDSGKRNALGQIVLTQAEAKDSKTAIVEANCNFVSELRSHTTNRTGVNLCKKCNLRDSCSWLAERTETKKAEKMALSMHNVSPNTIGQNDIVFVDEAQITLTAGLIDETTIKVADLVAVGEDEEIFAFLDSYQQKALKDLIKQVSNSNKYNDSQKIYGKSSQDFLLDYRPSFLDLKDGLTKLERKRQKMDAANSKPVKKAFLDLLCDLLSGYEGTSIQTTGIGSDNHTITFRSYNSSKRDSLIGGSVLVLMDATLSEEQAAKLLRTSCDEIAVIQQEYRSVSNATVTQFTGRSFNASRSANQQKEAKLIQSKYLKDPNTAIIDWIRHIEIQDRTGGHFSEGRGSNKFEERNTLVIIGNPTSNINATVSIASVFDRKISKEDQNKIIDQQRQSELLQELGRLRANNRPGVLLDIHIYNNSNLSWLSDFGFTVQLGNILDTVPELATAKDKIMKALTNRSLLSQIKDLTIREIVPIVHASAGTISRYVSEILINNGFDSLVEYAASLIDEGVETFTDVVISCAKVVKQNKDAFDSFVKTITSLSVFGNFVYANNDDYYDECELEEEKPLTPCVEWDSEIPW